MSKKAIVISSFGTSYLNSMSKNIESVEKLIESRFASDYSFHRVFTSQMIIDKIYKRDGLKIKNLREKLEELKNDAYEEVYIQPTLIMNGEEYDKLSILVDEYSDNFQILKIGNPLLHSHNDYESVRDILIEETEKYIDDESAVLFMGHGTEHYANASYACLDYHLKIAGSENYFVGTVEGFPAIEDVVKSIKKRDIKNVKLFPFMLVAGDHANNDMIGDEDDSWKSILEKEGYKVTYELKGLGEYEKIRDLYYQHLEGIIV